MTHTAESPRYLGIIPARGGSKRLLGKNLVPLAGRPLLDYTAAAARGAHRLGDAVLTTDDAAIASHGATLGLLQFGLRPRELAEDLSPLIGALQHALAAYERERGAVAGVVILQPTSPFRTASHIDQAIARFEASGADTVTAARAVHDHPYWVWRASGSWVEPYVSYDAIATERAHLPPAYAETGTVYVVRRDLIAAGRIYGARVAIFEVDSIAAVDIDTPLDLQWAEFLIARGLAGRADTK